MFASLGPTSNLWVAHGVVGFFVFFLIFNFNLFISISSFTHYLPVGMVSSSSSISIIPSSKFDGDPGSFSSLFDKLFSSIN